MQHPVSKHWDEQGVVIDVHDNGRSYMVRLINGKIIRRNRRFLRLQTFGCVENMMEGSSEYAEEAVQKNVKKNDLPLRRSDRLAQKCSVNYCHSNN